jgi:hypothetical protein
MANKPKRWPDHAETAREDAIANARRGREFVQSIYRDARMTSNPDILRVAASADDLFTAIILGLIAVGPQVDREMAETRPAKTHSEKVFA